MQAACVVFPLLFDISCLVVSLDLKKRPFGCCVTEYMRGGVNGSVSGIKWGR